MVASFQDLISKSSESSRDRRLDETLYTCGECGEKKTITNFVKARNICRACDRRVDPKDKKKVGRKTPNDLGGGLEEDCRYRFCTECKEEFLSVNGVRKCPKCKRKFEGILEDDYPVLVGLDGFE